MTADKTEVYTAAEVLQAIDELIDFQTSGILDVSKCIENAIAAFDRAECRSLADAVAFLTVARRLTTAVVEDMAKGQKPSLECAVAADRYNDLAMAFLGQKSWAINIRHCGSTVH